MMGAQTRPLLLSPAAPELPVALGGLETESQGEKPFPEDSASSETTPQPPAVSTLPPPAGQAVVEGPVIEDHVALV